MNNISGSIESILEDLGYKLTPDNNGWRSNRLYANGDNETALKIYPNGCWTDFVESKSGRFEELVALSLGNKTIDEAKEWLSNKDFEFKPQHQLEEPLIKDNVKTFPPELVNELKQDYLYWNRRGISDETLRLNIGGVSKGRYWFLIYNSKNQIIGKTGRDLTGYSKVKWLHKGKRNSWVYNAYLNNKIIREKKEIIIVESPGDYLSLYECGIKNVLVLFGVEMSLAILNYLLRISPEKIILSLNDDSNNNYVGNEATDKLYRRLTKYFDKHQLELRLPKLEKDWNLVLTKRGKDSIIEQLS